LTVSPQHLPAATTDLMASRRKCCATLQKVTHTRIAGMVAVFCRSVFARRERFQVHRLNHSHRQAEQNGGQNALHHYETPPLFDFCLRSDSMDRPT
jgi:hypothetical protein